MSDTGTAHPDTTLRRRRRWPIVVGVVAAGVIVFVAAIWAAAPTPDQLAQTWVLVEGRSFGEPIDQIGNAPITFTVADGRIGGHDGCNSFRVDGGVTAGWLWTTPLGAFESSLVACLGDGSDTADRYRSALTRWARWARVDPSGNLVLWGPATTLRFEVLEPGANADQWWTLVEGTVSGESFAAHDDPNLPAIWLSIPLDDTQPIEGNNGCTSWSAPHDAIEVGGAVTLGDRLERTDTDCAGHMGDDNAAAIRPVEELVYGALTTADRADRDTDYLVLTGPDVELVYELDR